MKPVYEVSNDAFNRVISVRMTGIFDEEAMRAWGASYRKTTDLYRGKKHMVVADMRGMKPVHPDIAALMGTDIGYARSRGVALCAHVSDSVVQRLQAARVARQNSPDDDVTVEVDSPEEARRVVLAYARFLDDPRFTGSIRGAISNSPPAR